MSLVTRQGKGSKLTIEEMDNNLTYLEGLGRPYKVYTALVSQSGTDAPVATVLENTIGNIVLTRNGIGQFTVTSDNLFTAYKTAVFITPTSASSGYPVFAFDTDFPNEDNLYIYSYGEPSGAPDNYEDGKLNKTTIEIRVYN
jgi:hypothetical protein